MPKQITEIKKNFIKTITLLSIITIIIFNSCGDKTTTKSINQMKNTKEIIVDVRSPEEWEFDGHANCSVNYPLDEIQERVEELRNYEHITLVCRSGNRAGVAKRILEGAGLKNIENLGPWQNVTCMN